MKIIALDSSGLTASVALLEEEELIAEYTVQYRKTHSQTLLPMLAEISRMVELDLNSVDAIAVAAGPGSFTGLRIGCAMAKGLGQALNIPLAGIPTVDALAYNLYGARQLICPLMDARRGQAYTGLYTFRQGEEGEGLQIIKPQCAVALEEILEEINGLNREVVFLGDGVKVFRSRIEEALAVPFRFAPPSHNRQRAAALGSLAFSYLKQGRQEAAGELKLRYLRKSQAERERQKKHGHRDSSSW